MLDEQSSNIATSIESIAGALPLKVRLWIGRHGHGRRDELV